MLVSHPLGGQQVSANTRYCCVVVSGGVVYVLEPKLATAHWFAPVRTCHEYAAGHPGGFVIENAVMVAVAPDAMVWLGGCIPASIGFV
jgi:hypothetical protein